jgi:hypothetical protein
MGMLERGQALRRALLFAACFTAAFLFGYCLGGRIVAKYVDPAAFLLVTTYAVILVLGRYSPGKCVYRLLVAASPNKHLPSEVAKATDFMDFVAVRLLFAGLIFTLVQIARVLAGLGEGAGAPSALSSTLTAALYALILYVAVRRVSASAAPWTRAARTPMTAA